jgi:hypothetical protein
VLTIAAVYCGANPGKREHLHRRLRLRLHLFLCLEDQQH